MAASPPGKADRIRTKAHPSAKRKPTGAKSPRPTPRPPKQPNPNVRVVYHKAPPTGFWDWMVGRYNFDMLSYQPQVAKLSQRMGVQGEENLGRINAVLAACSARIMHENSSFVLMVMAVMLVESTWNPEARNTQSGATGIMQVRPMTAVDALLRMDDKTFKELEKYLLPALTPEQRASWPAIASNVNRIRHDVDERAKRIPKGDRKTKISIIRERSAAVMDTSMLVDQSGILRNPTFNVGIGIFHLARIFEQKKQAQGHVVGEAAIEAALRAYNEGESSTSTAYNPYSDKVVRAYWLMRDHPAAVTFILDDRVSINNALELRDKNPQLLQEILSGKRDPYDAILYLRESQPPTNI